MYDTSAFANNAEDLAKKREKEAIAGTGLKPGELDAMKAQASELAELIKSVKPNSTKVRVCWT